jgi:hypothetical protein
LRLSSLLLTLAIISPLLSIYKCLKIEPTL